TGDVFFNGRYPFVDGSTGGRIDGMIAAADRLLSLADADTKIVPGHGPLATKADLAKYRDMLSQAADRVRKLKASGKSLDHAIAPLPGSPGLRPASAKLTERLFAVWVTQAAPTVGLVLGVVKLLR